MALKYRVTLIQEERDELEQLLAKGKAAARKLTHARILLKADASEGGPGWRDEAIVHALDCSAATVYRVRERFVMEGFEAALEPKPPARAYPRRLDGKGEAQLVTLACSQPPDGRTRWTLRLLADRLVELDVVDRISSETVRLTLKKTNSSRG
jgi:transposase